MRLSGAELALLRGQLPYTLSCGESQILSARKVMTSYMQCNARYTGCVYASRSVHCHEGKTNMGLACIFKGPWSSSWTQHLLNTLCHSLFFKSLLRAFCSFLSLRITVTVRSGVNSRAYISSTTLSSHSLNTGTCLDPLFTGQV